MVYEDNDRIGKKGKSKIHLNRNKNLVYDKTVISVQGKMSHSINGVGTPKWPSRKNIKLNPYLIQQTKFQMDKI